jgi:hypothetical protein
MPPSSLTPLQERILAILAGFDPPWTLSGGGALAGVHLGLRPTRDLDLFWHGQEELGHAGAEVGLRLQNAGLDVTRIQAGATFQRLRVSDGDETCIIDLVAEPIAAIEDQQTAKVGGAEILVDTPHEILVNKLCTLLGRTELRDLQDVKDLLVHGGDLDRALADAPRKDGGFSPLILAYVLRGFAVEDLGRAAGWSDARVAEIAAVRDDLVRRLIDAGHPPE